MNKPIILELDEMLASFREYSNIIWCFFEQF